MDMIAVGDVVLVGHAGDIAETFFEGFGKFISCRFHRCAVDGVTDMFFFFPFRTFVVQFLHDFEGKFAAFICRMGNAEHADTHFIEAGIAEGNGAVVIEKKFIDGFAFFQTGKGTVLPKNRSDIGNRAEKSFMTAAECFVAKFETFFQNFPEFIHISFCRASYIHKVDGYNALVETAIIFMSAVFSESFRIGGEEAAATHAGKNVTVFVLFHDFSGNIIGNKTFCRTFRSQFRQFIIRGIGMDIILIEYINEFRERRSNPYALFIFDALHSLEKYFFDNHGKIVTGASFRYFVKIHEHGDERCLAVTGHERDELVLDGLDTALDFSVETFFYNFIDDFFVHRLAGEFSFGNDIFLDFLTADIYEGSEMGQCEGLPAVLV